MDKGEELDLKSKIFFFFREKLFNQMHISAKEGISKFKGDTSFHLYQALSYILINRVEEGIHSLETILNENDTKLAVTIALMYAHKLAGNTNKDIFVKLDTQMRDYRKSSEAIDFYHAAFVLITFNKNEKALDYAEKALNLQSDMFECLTLKGWILLYLKNNKKSYDNIKDLFQRSLQVNPRYLDTIIGYSESCLYQNEFSDALNTINKAVVRYTSTHLPLIQKIKIHLAMLDWDQVTETINRVASMDSKNLCIRKLSLILTLCRSANYEEAIVELEKFIKLLELMEPKNTKFSLDSTRLFSKICGKNHNILIETSKLLEVTLQNTPENSELVVEMGYQALLTGKIKEASR